MVMMSLPCGCTSQVAPCDGFMQQGDRFPFLVLCFNCGHFVYCHSKDAVKADE